MRTTRWLSIALILLVSAGRSSLPAQSAAGAATTSGGPASSEASAAQPSAKSASAAPLPGADTVLDRRVRDVAQRLRCPVCQGESIQESPAELATQMKGVVREQLAAGRSEQDVLNYFLAKYGDWILLEPRAEGINLLVYWIPVIFMVIGGVFLFLTVKKWVKPRGAVPAAQSVTEP